MCDAAAIAGSIGDAMDLVLCYFWNDPWNVFVGLKSIIFDFSDDTVLRAVVNSVRTTQIG